MSQKILIIDDEPDIRTIVEDILSDEGFDVLTAGDATSGHEAFLSFEPDLILLDIWMPADDGSASEEGLKLLKHWTDEHNLSKPVIMISGHGNVETAVEAVKIGAYDFLEKPLSTAKLLLTVERAVQTNELRKENERLRGVSGEQKELIGDSTETIELKRQIKLLGPTNSWIFLTGEVGTGKHVVAQSVHYTSQRNGAFVLLNLAATPPESIATRLFGVETDQSSQAGCFEEAHMGTLFINEVLDLDFETQGKLLSALQESRLLRVGGKQYIDFDVRVITATSGDPEKAVREGRFREDLYFRLNVIPIKVPALRNRRQDIKALAEFHCQRLATLNNINKRNFLPGAVDAMMNYSWPGNIRQMINVINRLLLLNPSDEISEQEFTEAISNEADISSNEPLTFPNFFDLNMRDAKENFETMYLQFHLNKVSGNVSLLAKNIGMERTHLYRKLKALGIDPKNPGQG
ncbi:MAG: sigma-54-dependent transcriptional regulator [Arenicella sp.]